MKQSSEPKIIVNGLVKSFGNLEVLKGINAEIDKGEVICVIGPSGSGKSTFQMSESAGRAYCGGDHRRRLVHYRQKSGHQ